MGQAMTTPNPSEVIARLTEALTEMVYETTHLSPCLDDGSHRCIISAATLERARAALIEARANDDRRKG